MFPDNPTPEERRIEVLRCIRLIVSTEKWLDECPLRKADAFYETAAFPLEELRNWVREQATALEDHSLLSCLAEYEKGELDFRLETPDFWEELAKQFANEHDLA